MTTVKIINGYRLGRFTLDRYINNATDTDVYIVAESGKELLRTISKDEALRLYNKLIKGQTI